MPTKAERLKAAEADLDRAEKVCSNAGPYNIFAHAAHLGAKALVRAIEAEPDDG